MKSHAPGTKGLRAFLLPAICALLAPSIPAQNEPGGAQDLPPVVVTSTVPPGADPAAVPEEGPLPGRDGGIPGEQPVILDDDSIPLPIPARVQASDGGDRIIEAASGDPFFLGFAAGAYRPPAGEKIDPALLAVLAHLSDSQRPRAEVYAFVMFQKRMTARRLAEIESVGARILGFHPFYTMRAAIAPEAIPIIAGHPAVRWVGLAQPWQKIHPYLAELLAKGAPSDVLNVYISLFESDLGPASTWEPMPGVVESTVDPNSAPVEIEATLERATKIWTSNGWQQRALEALGVVIDEYVPEIAAFRARISPRQIAALAALDFVQFIESDVPDQVMHDESMALIHADRTRADYNGGTNSVAITGEIDSGIETAHLGLNHFYGVGWTQVGGSSWDDLCGHGSHVAGTILGEPTSSNLGYRGAAYDLGWAATGRIRNVKIFPNTSASSCGSATTSHSSRYSYMRNPYTDGSGNVSARPHAINNSWGADPGSSAWVGSEANARTLDNEVWNHDQLYVFAAGNAGSGSGTIGLPAVAKNAFTVGNVVDYRSGTVGDPGNLWTSSSRGPCGDNRWKPNVVAPGRLIRSVNSSTSNGYVDKSGTSMATPHVVGLAAQLVDHHSWTRYAPHRLASLMMATATPKDNHTYTTETDTHLDQYGTGRINAYRAHYGDADWSWTNWGFTQTTSWHYSDFTVPSNATRLVVVMTYHEPASSSGASQALVKNIDLYLDRDPIDPNGNTGEYFVQQSSRDNTEIRTVNSPAAGAWRWKAWPRTTSGSARVSVTVLIITSDYTPNLVLSLSASDQYVQPSDQVDITASVHPSDFMASAVFLDSTVTSSGRTLHASSTTLKDGVTTDLMGNQHGGYDVLLGDTNDHSSRAATWTVSWSTEGNKTWSVNARSDTATNATTSVTVTVDGTAPGLATNLHSSTHTSGQWSNDPSITYNWTAATDNLSGVDGYGIFTSTTSTGAPSNTKDIGAVTTYSESLTDSNGWYFKMKTVDRSGNWTSSFAVTGPYKIDTVAPGLPTRLHSTSHTVNVWSNDPSVDFAWGAASDDRSGVDGYGESWSSSPGVFVANSKDMEETVTSRTRTFSTNSSGWYYALKTVDNAGNWTGTTTEVGPYKIDTIAPSGPSGLSSPTHTIGTWSNNATVGATWTAASDAHSGLAGYRAVWDHSSSTAPTGTLNVTAGATSLSRTLATSASGWYLHLRARDAAGNWGTTRHLGPFRIDTAAPSGPSGLTSTSHTAGAWSNQATIQMSWAAATDPHSGLAGYRGVWDTSAGTNPSGSLNLSAGATSASRTVTNGAWYFHLRARDAAGNWGTTRHAGPYRIDLGAPSASLTIDSGNPTTTALGVSLAITASDPASGLDTMRFRNDGGGWSAWQSFAATKAWNLTSNGGSSATGTRTVLVQVRDRAGNTRQASDTIYYYTPVQYFGSACAGSMGIPLLSVSGIPGVGRTVTFSTTNSAAVLRGLYLGLSNSNWLGIPLPLDLAIIGDPGCMVNVSLDVLIATGGLVPIPVPIPADGTLIGGSLFFQDILLGDPSGKLAVTTRGVEVIINGF